MFILCAPAIVQLKYRAIAHDPMAYWRLFYHFVWSTKLRRPLIQPEIEASLHNVIAAKATQVGAFVHAVGGVEDHVHLVASVPPALSLSDFVSRVKGNSSHFVNHEFCTHQRHPCQTDVRGCQYRCEIHPTLLFQPNGFSLGHAGEKALPLGVIAGRDIALSIWARAYTNLHGAEPAVLKEQDRCCGCRICYLATSLTARG